MTLDVQVAVEKVVDLLGIDIFVVVLRLFIEV